MTKWPRYNETFITNKSCQSLGPSLYLGSTTGSPSSKYEHRRTLSLLRNIRNIRICMGKKPIVSVTFENERVSIKNSLPYLKWVLRLSCVVHGPICGRFMGFWVNGRLIGSWRFSFLQLYIERKPFTQKPIKRPYIGPWTTQEGRNTHLRKVSSFLLKSFHFWRLQKR